MRNSVKGNGMTEYILIQIQHPHYAIDEMLAGWLALI